MKIPHIPVVKVPLLDLTTDPFDLLLAGLGLRMQQLAYQSDEFKELLKDRDFTLQLNSKEGIARYFSIKEGKVSSTAGMAPKADFTLTFNTNAGAVSTLTKGDPTAFMAGMQDGSIQMEGDFALLMWFNQAARLIVPKVPPVVLSKVKQVKAFLPEVHEACDKVKAFIDEKRATLLKR